MKKILLSICCAFAVSATFAQTTQLGIKAGVNFAKLTADAGSNGSGSTGNLTGFHVGVIADFDLGNNISIQPGLLYSMKGGKDQGSITADDVTYSVTSKTTLNYLEVPVNFLYKVPAGPGKIYFGAGPYLGYGISGKSKVDESSSNLHSEEDIKFGSGDEELKNPDFGANFLAGIELKNGFLIGVNYGLGLADLENTSAGSIKNRVFGISVGFLFK